MQLQRLALVQRTIASDETDGLFAGNLVRNSVAIAAARLRQQTAFLLSSLVHPSTLLQLLQSLASHAGRGAAEVRRPHAATMTTTVDHRQRTYAHWRSDVQVAQHTGASCEEPIVVERRELLVSGQFYCVHPARHAQLAAPTITKKLLLACFASLV